MTGDTEHRFPRTARYDAEWIRSLDMGPHPLWQLEDLLNDRDLGPGSRVLDLGCGRGATSVFLAREYGVEGVAFDLWIDEQTIRATTDVQGVSDRVTVVHGDVHHLPFADEEFDAIISIDALEYFGTDVHILPAILRALKPGGWIGMTTPALAVDPYESAPPPLVSDLFGWEVAAWHSPAWWATHWTLSGQVTDVVARMQDGSRDLWLEWSQSLREDPAGSVQTMLRGLGDGEIGIAVVSALKALRS